MPIYLGFWGGLGVCKIFANGQQIISSADSLSKLQNLVAVSRFSGFKFNSSIKVHLQ